MNYKIKVLSITTALFLSCSLIFSQEEESHIKCVGGDLGLDFYPCLSPSTQYIRGDIVDYGYGTVYNNITSLLYRWHFSVKGEYRFWHNRLALSSGLRFSRMTGTIGKSNYFENASDYFFLLYKQEGTTSEYLKVKEIRQVSNYLGIPLEFRLYPSTRHFFRPYIKVAAEANFLIGSKDDVVFSNSAMDSYQDEVIAKFDKVGNFLTKAYLGIGFNWGYQDKPSVNVELNMPGFILNKEATGMVKTDAGFGVGIQLAVFIPIK